MKPFRWGKLILSTVGAPVATAFCECIHAAQAGHPCSLTAGHILVPALPVALYGLLNLFSKRPHDG